MVKFNPSQAVKNAYNESRKQMADLIESGGHEAPTNVDSGAPVQVSTNAPKDAAPDAKPVPANPGKQAPITPAKVKSQQESNPEELDK